MKQNPPPVFRFAPSPNGALHLGHAYSALINQRCCQQINGTLLLRLEDIDQTRCTPELEAQMLADLNWIGFTWSGTPRRQSQHFDDYQAALQKLHTAGLIYPAFMTRGEIRAAVADKARQNQPWPTDPDGAPHYPGPEAQWSLAQHNAQRAIQPKHTWRLNMTAALASIASPLTWQEFDCTGTRAQQAIKARPQDWGDVVLARSDTPTSYHLSVVVDDALQGVTHIVRGRDLFDSTAVHRLLQTLLGLPTPLYHHHDLVLGRDGRKLSKSQADQGLQHLRETGVKPEQLAALFSAGGNAALQAGATG